MAEESSLSSGDRLAIWAMILSVALPLAAVAWGGAYLTLKATTEDAAREAADDAVKEVREHLDKLVVSAKESASSAAAIAGGLKARLDTPIPRVEVQTVAIVDIFAHAGRHVPPGEVVSAGSQQAWTQKWAASKGYRAGVMLHVSPDKDRQPLHRSVLIIK